MNKMKCLKQKEDGIHLSVYVKPNSKIKSFSFDETESFLRVTIKASPDKGKANKELVKYLAKILSLSSANLNIIAGQTSQDKIILLTNIELDDVNKKLKVGLEDL